MGFRTGPDARLLVQYPPERVRCIRIIVEVEEALCVDLETGRDVPGECASGSNVQPRLLRHRQQTTTNGD